MPIKIFNTLTGKKEEFKPVKKGRVGMYVCGVTVYDDCHIGHVRGGFTFDIVRRYFEYKGYKVRYVRNITDVDDKIIEKARKEVQGSPRCETRVTSVRDKVQGINKMVQEVAKRYTKSYYEDMKSLGIRKADVEPKATAHIKDMIELIERLIERGYGYVRDGDIYFNVRKCKGYGKLSGQTLDAMRSGARIEIDEKKDDPLDFALWKSSKDDEPYWQSPWGCGRPGWHIECSVMSVKYLGENFDIHGGGIDLIFPHHENEIAQSECTTGKVFANYWMHNGLLTINGTKMAKSLGNFVSVKDIVKRFHPEVLKIFFLSSHYRSPIDFSLEKMEEAKRARERFYVLFDKLKRNQKQATGLKGKKRYSDIDEFRKRFEEEMDDDFNTAGSLSVLFDLVTYVNKQITENPSTGSGLRPSTGLGSGREQRTELEYAEDMLLELGKILGLFEKDKLKPKKTGISKEKIKQLINQRNEARQKKDFKTADRIREELDKKGIILEDGKDGTAWRMR